MVAVASVLAGYADSDGRNCYPAIETIMSEAGTSRRTVRLVLGRLVESGWLAVTAKAVQWHRPTVYRLTFPMGAEEHPMEDARISAEEHPMNTRRMGAPLGAAMGAEEHPDLLPPTEGEEEEESAGVAALAALSPDDTKWAQAVAGDIARRAKVVIDPGRCGLGSVLLGAMKRAGGETALIVYCVEKLKQQGRRVHDPSAFLAKDLSTRLTDSMMPSPRMAYAAVIGRLFDLCDESVNTEGLEYFERSVQDAGLVDKVEFDEDVWQLVDVWEVKDSLLEQLTQFAREAVSWSESRLEVQRDCDPVWLAQCQCGVALAPYRLPEPGDIPLASYRCGSCGSEFEAEPKEA
jgi:hypothetical protein